MRFSGSLLVLAAFFCVCDAAVLRNQRTADTRALLANRAQLVHVCAHTGPDCGEGCVPEENCPIGKVIKEITVDCEDIKKELSDDDPKNPCAGVLPGQFEDCKTELEDKLETDLPPQEKDYCECMKKKATCENEKQACCDQLENGCGPFKVPDLVVEPFECDFGKFDEATEGDFYKECMAGVLAKVEAAKERMKKAQAAINARKKECKDLDTCCKKDCDDCKPKCLIVENTKKLSCDAYKKCMKTATDALKKKMKEAREQAQKLNARYKDIAEIKCEAEAEKKGAGADAAEKCKASINDEICPIDDCKAPKPDPCDPGDPVKCVKEQDAENWPEETCGPQPTPTPTKKPTPTPTWVPPTKQPPTPPTQPPQPPTKEPPGPVPPVPPTKEPPVPPCEEPKNCKRVSAEEAAIKCKTSPKFAEKCKCTCKPGPPPPPPPPCKKDCNEPNGKCLGDECFCKDGFCGENCESADCGPTCPDGKTPLPVKNCGPACKEGKCPDGITCKGPGGCGPTPCKPKPGFGVCPDGKQCKANPGGTNCGPDPCKPKPGFGVCPDGLTCKKDKDGANCGPIPTPKPPGPPVPPGCEEPEWCKKAQEKPKLCKKNTPRKYKDKCKCSCGKVPPPIPPKPEDCTCECADGKPASCPDGDEAKPVCAEVEASFMSLNSTMF